MTSAAMVLHGGEVGFRLGEAVTGWHVPPSVAAGVALLAAGYLWLTMRVAPRPGVAASGRGRRMGCWMAGLVVMLLALTGPLHDLSDHYLFSAHMVQHLLLTMALPPLLVAGTPEWVVRRALRWPQVARAARILARPMVAGALFAATLALWHLPGLYELTMRNHGVHVLEHLLFMITGVIAWWPVLAPVGEHRISYGRQMLYLFLLGLPMKAVGALVTFSESVLYPFYAAAPRTWGLDYLVDQQIGGLVMWVLGGMTFWAVLTVVWFRWYLEEGKGESVLPPDVRAGRAIPAAES